MDKKTFTALFSSRRDAVVAVKDGAVAFYNDAAEKLFNRIFEGQKAEELFSLLLIECENGTAAGSVRVDGQDIPAVSNMFEDMRVITVMPEPERDSIFMDTMGSINTAVRDSLAIMQMTSGLIEQRMSSDDEKIVTYNAVLRHACSSLMRVTDHVTELCVQGSQKLKISCFDMVEVCRDVVESTVYIACTNGPTLTFNCAERAILFNGDKGRIEQLLLNLLSNSLKYTPSDGKITVMLKKTKTGVILTVEDTGCGIDEKKMPGLFSVCAQTRDLKDIKSGLGMGLPLVQHIANLHMGSAVLETTRKKGTKVTVSLTNKDNGIVLETPEEEYRSGGLSRTLMELSDIVNYEAFLPKNVD